MILEKFARLRSDKILILRSIVLKGNNGIGVRVVHVGQVLLSGRRRDFASTSRETFESLGSGGSMVARLKLEGIDGRAPPGVESAA